MKNMIAVFVSAVFLSVNIAQARIKPDPGLEGRADLSLYEAFLAEMDLRLTGLQKTDAEIYAGKAGAAGIYIPGGDIMFGAEFKDCSGKIVQNEAASQVMLAHEYGHAVFETNIAVQSPSWRKIRNDSMEQPEKISEATGRYMEVMAGMAAAEDKAAQKAKAAAIMEELVRLKTEMKNNGRLLNLTGAFHELWADFIAAYMTGDPQANYLSAMAVLQCDAENRNMPQHQYRKMDLVSGQNEVERWKKDIAAYIDPVFEVEPYSAFAPSKAELWKMAQKEMQPGAKAEAGFPVRVFNALRDSFELVMKTPVLINPVFKVEEIDEIILTALKKQMP